MGECLINLREALMYKLTGVSTLVAAIGAALLIASSFAHAQVDGAVQYPPASVGQDAQASPPARMVPQSVSPRRIELGVSGSSQSSSGYPAYARRSTDTDRPPTQPPLGGSSTPSSRAGGN